MDKFCSLECIAFTDGVLDTKTLLRFFSCDTWTRSGRPPLQYKTVRNALAAGKRNLLALQWGQRSEMATKSDILTI